VRLNFREQIERGDHRYKQERTRVAENLTSSRAFLRVVRDRWRIFNLSPKLCSNPKHRALRANQGTCACNFQFVHAWLTRFTYRFANLRKKSACPYRKEREE